MVSGATRMTWARGFSSTLRRVLLKNCTESATCSSSMKWTIDRYVTLGTPSLEQVPIGDGTTPSKHEGIVPSRTRSDDPGG